MSLEDYMQLSLFGPLGMSSTTFRISEHPELQLRRADIGLRTQPEGLIVKGANYKPDVTPMDCGGVGLYSTATDYAKLLAALLDNGGPILKSKAVEELLCWQLPDSGLIRDHFWGEHHAIFAPEFPDAIEASYGLYGAINQENIPGKRHAGSVMWHGIHKFTLGKFPHLPHGFCLLTVTTFPTVS